MTVKSEYIDVKENGKSLRKEVLTTKVFERSYLKMQICKDKDSDGYDSYQFTNQDGDSFICKAQELTELLLYFKPLEGTGNGIMMSVYNEDKISK